jgi:hypothetical protein
LKRSPELNYWQFRYLLRLSRRLFEATRLVRHVQEGACEGDQEQALAGDAAADCQKNGEIDEPPATPQPRNVSLEIRTSLRPKAVPQYLATTGAGAAVSNL